MNTLVGFGRVCTVDSQKPDETQIDWIAHTRCGWIWCPRIVAIIGVARCRGISTRRYGQKTDQIVRFKCWSKSKRDIDFNRECSTRASAYSKDSSCKRTHFIWQSLSRREKKVMSSSANVYLWLNFSVLFNSRFISTSLQETCLISIV